MLVYKIHNFIVPNLPTITEIYMNTNNILFVYERITLRQTNSVRFFLNPCEKLSSKKITNQQIFIHRVKPN